MLHVAALGLVARENRVHAFQRAVALPGGDFVPAEPIVSRVAFAEDQPVAPVAGGAARLDQGAQAGQARAVAHQDQGAAVGGRVKIAVDAHAQVYRVAGPGDVGQPAAAQSQRAVRAAHLAHEQLDRAVLGQRGDGVFAVSVQRAAGFPARADLGDVAGLPGAVHIRGRCQRQQVAGAALAVRIEPLAGCQAPRLICGRLPIGQVAASGQQPKVMLPVAQRGRVAVVDLDQIEKGYRALRVEPFVEAVAEAAEVRVFAVAQRQHRVLRAGQRGRAARGFARPGRQHLVGEGRRGVGRIAFAIGAGDEQHAAISGQAGHVQLVQRGDAHRQSARAQRVGRLLGQRFGIAGLGRVGDQQGIYGHGGVQGLQRPRLLRFLAPGAAPGPEAQEQP
ncbi:hypothetical protein D9M68_594800 [compost metagenome]